jgi:hypothetical protein
MRFRVTCDPYLVTGVNRVVAVAAEQAADWAEPWQKWVKSAVDASDTGERLAVYRAERDRLLAAGELAETRAQLLRQATADYLTEKGWRRRRWKPIPEGEYGPGRRWGAATEKFEATMTIDLPDEDGELVRRVAHWTSAPAVRGLREWTDRHGRGPAHIADLPPSAQGPASMAMAMTMPSARHMREREKLRKNILTVGAILRDVVRCAARRTYTQPESVPPLF